MCGRTACPIDPVTLRRACSYKSNAGDTTKWKQPTWKAPPNDKQFIPSYNAAPGAYLPVLISGVYEKSECSEYILQPMQWGLVPHWHRGNPKEFSLNMNNCRSESMLQKKSFKVPLEKGQRCVAVADGFFEWKTHKDGKKQPYFIYFPQDTFKTEVKQEDESWSDEDGWIGRRLLTMAAVFDIWQPSGEEYPLYSFSIITVDSSPSLSWLHHRMPAILDGEEAVRDWLDFKNVPLKKAIQLIHPIEELQWHPVTSSVNNSRYKGADCVLPINLEEKASKLSNSGNFMMSWLGQKKTKSELKSEDIIKTETSQTESPVKNKCMDGWLLKNKCSKETTEDVKKEIEDGPSNKKLKLE